MLAEEGDGARLDSLVRVCVLTGCSADFTTGMIHGVCGEEKAGPNDACGARFGAEELTYDCRTCRKAPTARMCIDCFDPLSHADHDWRLDVVGGGVCDCGDPTAFRHAGCSQHCPAPEVRREAAAAQLAVQGVCGALGDIMSHEQVWESGAVDPAGVVGLVRWLTATAARSTAMRDAVVDALLQPNLDGSQPLLQLLQFFTRVGSEPAEVTMLDLCYAVVGSVAARHAMARLWCGQSYSTLAGSRLAVLSPQLFGDPSVVADAASTAPHAVMAALLDILADSVRVIRPYRGSSLSVVSSLSAGRVRYASSVDDVHAHPQFRTCIEDLQLCLRSHKPCRTAMLSSRTVSELTDIMLMWLLAVQQGPPVWRLTWNMGAGLPAAQYEYAWAPVVLELATSVPSVDSGVEFLRRLSRFLGSFLDHKLLGSAAPDPEVPWLYAQDAYAGSTPVHCQLPLHRFLSAVVSSLVSSHGARVADLCGDLLPMFRHVCEYPLSLLVVRAQVNRGMWERNDLMAAYNGALFAPYGFHLDLHLLQQYCAARCPTAVAVHLWCRFSAHQRLTGKDDERGPELLADFLQMALAVAADRTWAPYSPRGFLRTHLLQTLAQGPLLRSELEGGMPKLLSNDPAMDGALDSVLSEIAVETAAGGGQLRLRDGVWAEVDPHYLWYSSPDTALAAVDQHYASSIGCAGATLPARMPSPVPGPLAPALLVVRTAPVVCRALEVVRMYAQSERPAWATAHAFRIGADLLQVAVRTESVADAALADVRNLESDYCTRGAVETDFLRQLTTREWRQAAGGTLPPTATLLCADAGDGAALCELAKVAAGADGAARRSAAALLDAVAETGGAAADAVAAAREAVVETREVCRSGGDDGGWKQRAAARQRQAALAEMQRAEVSISDLDSTSDSEAAPAPAPALPTLDDLAVAEPSCAFCHSVRAPDGGTDVALVVLCTPASSLRPDGAAGAGDASRFDVDLHIGGNAFVHTCGHVVHVSCVEEHRWFLRERGRFEEFRGKSLLLPSRGEFLCPLCSRIANAALPVIGVPTSAAELTMTARRGGVEPALQSVDRVSEVDDPVLGAAIIGMADTLHPYLELLLPSEPMPSDWLAPAQPAAEHVGLPETAQSRPLAEVPAVVVSPALLGGSTDDGADADAASLQRLRAVTAASTDTAVSITAATATAVAATAAAPAATTATTAAAATASTAAAAAVSAATGAATTATTATVRERRSSWPGSRLATAAFVAVALSSAFRRVFVPLCVVWVLSASAMEWVRRKLSAPVPAPTPTPAPTRERGLPRSERKSSPAAVCSAVVGFCRTAGGILHGGGDPAGSSVVAVWAQQVAVAEAEARCDAADRGRSECLVSSTRAAFLRALLKTVVAVPQMCRGPMASTDAGVRALGLLLGMIPGAVGCDAFGVFAQLLVSVLLQDSTVSTADVRCCLHLTVQLQLVQVLASAEGPTAWDVLQRLHQVRDGDGGRPLEDTAEKLLPLLRRLVLAVCCVKGEPMCTRAAVVFRSDAVGPAALAEACALLRSVGVPGGLSAVAAACVASQERLAAWLPPAATARRSPAPRSAPALLDLPPTYAELLSTTARRCSCGLRPRSPALCLCCGSVMCFRGTRCTTGGKGACTDHAAVCGGGTSAFLLLRHAALLVVRRHRVSMLPAPYVDAHGEHDRNLGRGRPLRLHQDLWRRYRRLFAFCLWDFDTQTLEATMRPPGPL